jgi:hypothetical protein
MSEQGSARSEASNTVGWTRLAIGFVQGLLFYGLYLAIKPPASWPATAPTVFAALSLCVGYLPLVPLASIAAMRRTSLIVWTIVAGAILAGLAIWDVTRDTGAVGDFNSFRARPGVGARMIPGFAVFLFSAVFLFIAHRLVSAADEARTLIAPYPAYFDIAWKHGLQLVLACAFTGVFWALLWLGAILFKLIGLSFIADIISKPWFFMPANSTVFAAAVHLTDVRVGLTRGIRTVVLTLLSWLMPLMAVIAIGFLAALPATGLHPLWKVGSATAILLSVAAVLIVLLNAAYQDGSDETRAGAILRLFGRATALALTPLVGIAVYGLWLRVGQYGLTPERIIAMACALVGACYAVGYGVAAVLPGPWMKLLERTNVATAVVILAVIGALLSPLADPVRLSVDDQVARLKAGRVAPDKFDYRFLSSKAGAYGRKRLAELVALKAGPNAKAIAAAAANPETSSPKGPYASPTPPQEQSAAAIAMHPKGAVLPADFLSQRWESYLSPCRNAGDNCQGYLLDVDGDGSAEVVVMRGSEVIAYQRDAETGKWARLGEAQFFCPGKDGPRSNELKLAPARLKDVVIDGMQLQLRTTRGPACPHPVAVTSADPKVER